MTKRSAAKAAKKAQSDKLTDRQKTAAMKAALQRTYAAPECAVLFEVGDATGGRATNFADALVMHLWPSRGLELWGMEIKASRSDWKRERAKPEKAEKIAAYCDRWWLLCWFDVIVDMEVPPAWGIITFDGKRLKIARQATQNPNVKPIDRLFLAGMLRRASKTDDALIEAIIEQKDAQRREQYQQDLLRNASVAGDKYARLYASVQAFETASGLKIDAYDGEELGKAVAVIKAMGMHRFYQNAFTAAHDLGKAADEAVKLRDATLAALTAAGFEAPERPDRQLPLLRRNA